MLHAVPVQTFQCLWVCGGAWCMAPCGRPCVKAEKARLKTQLKAAQAGDNQDNGKPRTESQVEAACREVVAEAAEAAEVAQKEAAEWQGGGVLRSAHPSIHSRSPSPPS